MNTFKFKNIHLTSYTCTPDTRPPLHVPTTHPTAVSAPSSLSSLHPTAWDTDVRLDGVHHTYSIKVGTEWESVGIVGVTSWIKRFASPDAALYDRASRASAHSINSKYMAGEAYPTGIHALVSGRDWAAMRRFDQRCSVLRHEFRGTSLIEHVRWPTLVSVWNWAETVRDVRGVDSDTEDQPPSYGDWMRRTKPKPATWNDMSDEWKNTPYKTEMQARFCEWRALGPSATTEQFCSIFKTQVDQRIMLRMPPFITAQDVAESWPRFGTRMHKDIERFINDGSVPEDPYYEFCQFLRFNHERLRTYTPFRTELTMSFVPLRLCGQCDFVARKANGKYVLWDWKRTASLLVKPGPSTKPMLQPWSHRPSTSFNIYVIQLNLYRFMLERGGIDVDEMYLVCFHSSLKAPYEMVKVEVFERESADGAAMAEMMWLRAHEVGTGM